MSVAEAKLIHSLREGRQKCIIDSLSCALNPDSLLKLALEIVTRQVRSEVKHYSADQNSLIQKTSGADIYNFSYTNLNRELNASCPTVTTLIESVCVRDNIDKLTYKTRESLMAPMTHITAILLSIYNQKMSASRLVTSLILCEGGAKESCINRFANLKLSYSYQWMLSKIDSMTTVHKGKLEHWKQGNEPYHIVLDNVDKNIKRTSGGNNKMVNMVQVIALKDRVLPKSSTSLPHVHMRDVKSTDLLPNARDLSLIRSDVLDIVRQIWSDNIPALKSLARPSIFTTHLHSAELRQKSDVVGL